VSELEPTYKASGPILGVVRQTEHVVNESGETYNREEIFVKLYVRFRERALRELKGPMLSVLICLATHSGEEMTSFPGIQKIAEETGYKERAIQYALRGLEKLNYISVTSRLKDNGSPSSNLYTLTSFFGMGKGGGAPGCTRGGAPGCTRVVHRDAP